MPVSRGRRSNVRAGDSRWSQGSGRLEEESRPVDHRPRPECGRLARHRACGDNLFIAVVRFASADAAKRNSESPEQGRWWAEVTSSLEGETHFADYDDVILLGPGGSDDSGFVQVMQGRVVDAERERAMTRDFAQRPMDFRPDILGGVAAIGDDGTFVQSIYLTSEAEEREGEQKPMPADMQKMMEQSQANTTEISFIDLISPTFASAT